MKDSFWKTLLGIAGLVVLVLIVFNLFERIEELRDGQKELCDSQKDLARSWLARSAEPLQLADAQKAPKGLMGYRQLPPEPLPPAPA